MDPRFCARVGIVAVGVGLVAVGAAVDVAGEEEVGIKLPGGRPEFPVRFGQGPAPEFQPFAPEGLCVVYGRLDVG